MSIECCLNQFRFARWTLVFGQDAAADCRVLHEHGITTVLVPAYTGHPHTPPPLFESEFDYHIWPVLDVPGFPIIWAFPTFVRAIASALSNGTDNKADIPDNARTDNSRSQRQQKQKQSQAHAVLVHCANGVSRSVAVVAAYLMVAEQLSADEALDAVRAVRPKISGKKFRDQLVLWGELNFDLEHPKSDGSSSSGNEAFEERKGRDTLLKRLRKLYSLKKCNALRDALNGNTQTFWPKTDGVDRPPP